MHQQRLTKAQRELSARHAVRATKRDAMLGGVLPQRGLWIVHHARRRVYGQVDCVRSSGVVVWREPDFGALVETEAGTLYDGGYSYEETRPASYELVSMARGAA